MSTVSDRTAPHVYLHIGTPKTGTTSFQAWCAQNRKALRRQGVLYPRSLGPVNHIKAMVYSADFVDGDRLSRRNSVTTPEELERFRAELETAFSNEVTSVRPSAVLVSNEHLYSRLVSESMVRRAKDLVSRVGDEVTVVVHVRPQIDLLVSNSSQAARLGKVVTSQWFTRGAVGPKNPLYDLSGSVALWERVFGAENVRTVPFRRRPDMSAVVTDLLGLDPETLSGPLRANEALGWRAIAVSNALVEHGVDKRLGPKRFKALLAGLPTSERLQVGLDVATTVHERFADGNADLVARRPDLEASDLEPDWEKYRTVPNVQHVDAAMDLSAEIAAAVEFASTSGDVPTQSAT